MKKVLAFVLAAAMIFTVAAAEETSSDAAEVCHTENGDVYVVQDEENGIWAYDDGSLSIHINRYTQEKPYRVWYVTDIVTNKDNPISNVFANPEKKSSYKYHKKPYEMADSVHAILAINDDYWQYRSEKNIKPGIVIKDGQIISDVAIKSGSSKFPNQDIFAIFGDGSVRTFQSNEHTAQEYLDMGVTDTLCFGPILVQNGQLGPHMEEDDKFFHHSEAPRTAIGYYSPYHYVILTVQNTVKPGSKSVYNGFPVQWLAGKMMELGVQEAINLDGGGSTFLIFMGKILNRSSNAKAYNIRSMSSMIYLGTLPEEMWGVYNK